MIWTMVATGNRQGKGDGNYVSYTLPLRTSLNMKCWIDSSLHNGGLNPQMEYKDPPANQKMGCKGGAKADRLPNPKS